MKYEKAKTETILFPDNSFCFIKSYNDQTCPTWTYVEGIGNCVGYKPDSYDGSFECTDYDDWQEWDVRDLGGGKYCKDYWD